MLAGEHILTTKNFFYGLPQKIRYNLIKSDGVHQTSGNICFYFLARRVLLTIFDHI